VLYLGLLDHDSDCRLAVPDVARPVGIPKGSRASCDGFIKAVGGHLDAILDAGRAFALAVEV